MEWNCFYLIVFSEAEAGRGQMKMVSGREEKLWCHPLFSPLTETVMPRKRKEFWFNLYFESLDTWLKGSNL